MDLDMSKIITLGLSKTKKTENNLTEDEKNFLSSIFSKISDSEDPEKAMEYLAGIYGITVSQIKLLRNVYYFYLATTEEKIQYNKKNKELQKVRKKEGFIDITAMISIAIVFCVIGLTLAYILYNLI